MNENVIIDRHKYIGGSDLPTILGYNEKYGITPYDLALEKAQIKERGFNGNEYTKYGQVMEPIIREYVNAIYNSNYKEDTIVDNIKAYRGNTDGIDIMAEYPILEIKTFGNELDVEYYEPQCQFYMETFNQNACLLVGYKRPENFYSGIDYEIEYTDEYFNFDFASDNLEFHVIKRDAKKWSKIEERIQSFQKAVDYIKSNKETYTINDFESLFYGNDLMLTSNKVALFEQKLSKMKEIENEYKKVKDDLYKIFENKGIVSFSTGNIKITKIAPVSYDTVTLDSKRLENEEPNIFERYKKIKTTNRKGYVLITNKKGN